MKTIDVLEMQANFDALLDRVGRGERFTVVRRGEPVAKLLPADEHDRERVEAAVARLQTFSRGLTLDGDWREYRDAGRKW